MNSLLVVLLSLVSHPSSTAAFVFPPSFTSASSSSSSSLVISALKAKKTSNSSGRGFGKSSSSIEELDDEADAASASAADSSPSLQSTNSKSDDPPLPVTDPSLSPEDRSKAILRQKFGLKSYEEQRAMEGDARALADSAAKAAKRDKLRNLDKVWPEDKDLFELLPPPLLRGIDLALKVGLGVCTSLFVASGVFITIEAGSKATGNELPTGLQDWVVNVVQPNFTPLLGVLLGFSVGLGLFSAGQLGSKGSVYREDP